MKGIFVGEDRGGCHVATSSGRRTSFGPRRSAGSANGGGANVCELSFRDEELVVRAKMTEKRQKNAKFDGQRRVTGREDAL